MYPKILTLPPTSFVSAPIPGADASLSNLTGVIEPSIAFIKGKKGNERQFNFFSAATFESNCASKCQSHGAKLKQNAHK
jgi:hypothetical protein